MNGLKLRDFLADEDIAAFINSNSVSSFTFKERYYGPKLPDETGKETAEKNSDEWYFVESPGIAGMPSSNLFDNPVEDELAAPSEAGTSASHASTPPSGKAVARKHTRRH